MDKEEKSKEKPQGIDEFKSSPVRCISSAEEMNAAHRPTMEDTFVAHPNLIKEPSTAFFGVYDGHGGREVSEYLRLHLHVNVAEELKLRSGRSVEECLRAAFIRTDADAGRISPDGGDAAGSMPSGSTAVTVVVMKTATEAVLFCANCGDARAVLCDGGKPIRLSKDHKASDPGEIKRIKDAGGFVIRNRVMGVLAVSRSFGDFVLKSFVPAEPHVSRVALTAKMPFVIIACDGLWDVIDDQEAINMVQTFVKQSGAQEKEVAKHLVKQALKRGSMDNITVMVVFL